LVTVRGRSALDVTDWRGGGAAHDAGFLVVELDGQGGVGDRDGEGLPGAGAAERGFNFPAVSRWIETADWDKWQCA
jgi:hypothetical protein